MKNLNDVVVDKLCKIMGEKDITQYRLALVSGVPFATVKSIMQRRTKDINLKTLTLLLNGLGMRLDEFFDDENFYIENLDIE